MKNTYLYYIILICNITFFSVSQAQEIPDFYIAMEKKNPNFYEVDSLYQKYIYTFDLEKSKKNKDDKDEYRSIYEKYFIQWIKNNKSFFNDKGFIEIPSHNKQIQTFNLASRARKVKAVQSDYDSNVPYHTTWSGWKIDAIEQLKERGGVKEASNQANVRAFAQSKSNPNYLYSAVEGGPVFVSRNKGNTWHMATLGYTNMSNLTAIGISPINENYAYAAGNNLGVFKTSDAGLTWNNIATPNYTNTSIKGAHFTVNDVNKIIVTNTSNNPNQDYILLATKRGLFRVTNNSGTYTFTNTLDIAITDIVQKPDNNNIFYALGYDYNLSHIYFYKSIDSGQSWTKTGEKTGWYDPTVDIPLNPNESYGGRLAVSSANPEVVYAYVIEERIGKKDGGYLGLFRSNDSGDNWFLTNPNGPGEGTNGYNQNTNYYLAGYSNLYHQGFYNCAIVINPNNIDEIIIGGTQIHKSINGGKNFTSLHSNFNIHADAQTFYTQINTDGTIDTWLTNDGGINYSTDFFENTNNSFLKNTALTADYWGFDLGENTENYIGGTYHNGDKFRHEKYPKGLQILLAGGEDSTGIILSKNNENSVYTKAVGNIIMSENYLDNPSNGIGLNPKPFENYAGLDPVPYTQRDYQKNMYYYVNNETNQEIELYKNTPNSSVSSLLTKIPTIDGKGYRYIVDYNNPNIQYLLTNNRQLFFTNNAWKTKEQKRRPFNADATLAIDGKNPNKIYALNINSITNTTLLRESTNNGTTWRNITTPNNGLSYRHILTFKGIPNSYILFGRNNSRIFYFYNNTWKEYSETLPINMNILEPIINYKTQNIFMATSGYGVLKNKLPQEIINHYNQEAIDIKIYSDITKTNKPEYTFNVNNWTLPKGRNIVSKKWDFPGSTSVENQTSDNPKVTYNKYGRFNISLTLTDDNGQEYSKTFPNFFVVYPTCSCDLPKIITNNINNLEVWFSAEDYKNGRLYDKISAQEYNLEESQNISVENDPEFNNKPVFNIKDGSNHANINLNKTIEGKTLFIVNSLSATSTSNYPFLFGSSSNPDFHSERNRIFSINWISDSNRFEESNGGSTQINGIQTNFFNTQQSIKPAVYSLRSSNRKAGGLVNYIAKDRNQENRNWQGKIAEVLIFNKQLSNQEIQEINKYLIDKYNIK